MKLFLRIYSFFLLFLIDILSHFLFSQYYAVRTRYFNQENGLSKNNVLQVFSHPDGRIGLVTEDAIFLLDGFQTDKWITADLTGSSISAFYADENHVYVLTKNKGVLILNKEGTTITDSITLTGSFNPDQFIVHEKKLYLMTSRVRMSVYDLTTRKEITSENLKKIRPSCMVLFQNKIRIGHEKGLLTIQNEKEINESFIQGAVQAMTSSGDSLVIASGNELIVRKNEKNFYKFTWHIQKKSDIFLPGGIREIQKMTLDPAGRIWLVPEPGDELYLYKPGACIPVSSFNKIPSSVINYLHTDHTGNVWAGTFDYGALCIQFSPFQNISISVHDKIIPPGNFFKSGTNLIISTQNGLYEFNPDKYLLTQLIEPDPVFNLTCGNLIQSGNAFLVSIPTHPLLKNKNIFTSDRIKIIPVSAKNIFQTEKEIYITDMYDNIIRWDEKSNRITSDTLFSLPDFRTKVTGLKKMKDTLYILTTKGLFTGTQKNNFSLIPSTRNLNCIDFFVLNGEKILVHQQGILALHTKENHSLLQLDGIYHITGDDNYFYIVGSFGLIKTDKNFNSLLHLSRPDGLLNQTIRTVTCNEKYLFLAGSDGVQFIPKRLLRKRPIPLSVKNISSSHGNYADTGQILRLEKTDILKVELICPEFFFPEQVSFHYRIDSDGSNTESKIPVFVLSDISGGKHEINIGLNHSDRIRLKIFKERKFNETPAFWITIVGASLTFTFIMVLIIYRRQKIKSAERLLEEKERNLLKHQAMNALLSPHFIYNTLASIQNYMLQKDTLKASDFLGRFARLIRMIIDKAREEEIPLSEEIQRLTYYLELEKERFGDKLTYSLIVPEEVRELNPSIPNMIIQPFVENAILHGVLPKGSPGHVKVEFKKEKEKLYIIIEDDGVGFREENREKKEGHRSLAISTIRNILDLNSRLKKKSQQFHIEPLKDNQGHSSGTRVVITLEI
jgi:hypothetical protein